MFKPIMTSISLKAILKKHEDKANKKNKEINYDPVLISLITIYY